MKCDSFCERHKFRPTFAPYFQSFVGWHVIPAWVMHVRNHYRTHASLDVHVHACMHAHMNALCMHASLYAYMYEALYACILRVNPFFVCIHTCIHSWRRSTSVMLGHACEMLAVMYLQRGPPIAENESTTHRTHRTHTYIHTYKPRIDTRPINAHTTSNQ